MVNDMMNFAYVAVKFSFTRRLLNQKASEADKI